MLTKFMTSHFNACDVTFAN